MSKRDDAAIYLGISDPAIVALITDEVIEAITADDLGVVPQSLIDAGFDRLTDGDQDALLVFSRFLRAAGSSPSADDDR